MLNTQSKPRKPNCTLLGTDGNVFAIIRRVKRALRKVGEDNLADEFSRKALGAKSYDEVLRLCMEYVEVC